MERDLIKKGLNGVSIIIVDENSPAEEAGLKRNDVILEIDDEIVKDCFDFSIRIAAYKSGDKIKLRIWRNGRYMMKSVILNKWK